MVKRDEIVNFIYSYFGQEEIDKAQKKDLYGANGLQIKGNLDITGIALGVSANLELFKKAVGQNCNFILVHHGLRLTEVTFTMNQILKNRLNYLFENDLSLMGFHYLLDSHRQVGNNAVVLQKLGAKLKTRFDEDWGWVGELPKEKSITQIVEQLSRIYKSKPEAFLEGKKVIKTIAIVSGGGVIYPNSDITERLTSEIDLYVTGEAKEGTQAISREGNINYVSFGHYNTEVIGIQALGEIIKKQFPDLPVKFIDIPNKL